MRKFLFLAWALVFAMVVFADEQEYGLSDYFYPYTSRQYIISPEVAKKTNIDTRVKYSFEKTDRGNFLIEERAMTMGYQTQRWNTIYAYQISGNAIYSYSQVFENPLLGGTERYYDKLTLFVIPDKNKTLTWTENNRGSVYKCRAEYVGIRFKGIQQAIKITKETTVTLQGKKCVDKEWSYWLPGWGRILTKGQVGTLQPRVSEILNLIYYDPEVEELTPAEYNNWLEEQKREAEKKAAEELAAKKERALRDFKNSLKTENIKKKDSVVYKNIVQKVNQLFYAQVKNLPYDNTNHVRDIQIDINDKQVVSVTGDSLPDGLSEEVRNYVNALLSSQKLKQEQRTEPLNNVSARVPLTMTYTWNYTKGTYISDIAYKKGEWMPTKGSYLPREDGVRHEMLKLAHAYMEKNPKQKKLEVSVSYVIINGKLTVLDSSVEPQ